MLEAGEPGLVCPYNGRPVEPDWNYCPWHGVPVEAIRRGWVKVPSQSYGPKEAVMTFYEGLGEQDGCKLSSVLDVDSIFTSLIAEALAKQENLPEGFREAVHDRLVRPSVRLLRYYLLDFVTSPEVRTYFRLPAEVTPEVLSKLYYEEVDGSTAIVGPSRVLREQGARSILLRKDPQDGSWRITEFPVQVSSTIEAGQSANTIN